MSHLRTIERNVARYRGINWGDWMKKRNRRRGRRRVKHKSVAPTTQQYRQVGKGLGTFMRRMIAKLSGDRS